MKIAFGIIVFNGNYVLKEALESIYPFASQILVAEGPVGYWQEQGHTSSTDGTNDVLDSFPDPENKITIVHGQFSEKNEQCNSYISHMNDDIDYIWNLDSDEIFKPEDILSIIKLLKQEEYTTVGFKSISFYGGFNDYLTGFEEGAEFHRISRVYPGATWETHRPPTIANLPWSRKHLDFNHLANLGIRMYHYSYVFPEQVRQKINYYKNAVSKEYCIDNYFEKIYLPWVLGDDKEKHKIELKYNGVHEFQPNYRGECFTHHFNGDHPPIINSNLNSLKEKHAKQLRAYR